MIMGNEGKENAYCLLGHPVGHSISPAMHNTSFDLLSLPYSYSAIDTTEEALSDTISMLLREGYHGFNLTMPLKNAIIPYLDTMSEAANLSKSVNTVLIKDGALHGYTTDGIGYMNSLRDSGIHPEGKTMTLLGAGGAATSIAVQAALDGVSRIHIFKRQNASYEKTLHFCEMLDEKTSCRVILHPMEDKDALYDAIKESYLLTNGTNVGMGDDKSSLVPKEFLRKDLIVSDIIYHPAETTLLSDAKDLGATYINGKYMLLFQGAAAFTIWTGKEMPIQEIKEKIFNKED